MHIWHVLIESVEELDQFVIPLDMGIPTHVVLPARHVLVPISNDIFVWISIRIRQTGQFWLLHVVPVWFRWVQGWVGYAAMSNTSTIFPTIHVEHIVHAC